MKKFKNKKLLIIIIALAVLILIVGTVFAFVATDIFKSDKDLFFKYASQLLDNEKGLLDNKLEQYNQKKINSKYEFLGNFSADIDSESLDDNALRGVENLEISFAGNVNNILEQAESLVKINYSSNSNFPILFKKSNGLVGIKLNDVVKKYLAVKENEIQSLQNKAGINIPFPINSIDFSNINTSNQDNGIKDKYIKIIKDNLEDSKFSRVKGMNSEGYCLEISNEKILDILVKVLDNLKDDSQALDKLYYSFGLVYNKEDVEATIQYLSSLKVNEGKSRITIYQKDGKLNKIEIQFNDLVNITITKTSTDNDVNYNFYAETQNYSISFDAKYSGLNTLQSVDEKYSLNLTMGDSYTYNVENTVNFTDEIEIKDFTEDEYSDLNKMNKEQLTKLFDALTKSIDIVNKQKLELAELNGQNPLLSLLPDFSKLFVTTSSSTDLEDLSTYKELEDSNNNEVVEKNENTSNNNNNELNTNTNSNSIDTNNNTNTNNSSSNIVENMEKVEKESFNARFTQYEGNNVRGATVKSLMMQIIATNMADEEKQIKVTGDITLNGDEVPSNIVATKTYTVKCSTGIDGYVNSVEVLENN
ncbi:MAG: hypothetical protein IKF97_06130 [Clostridia bacterium]|nr:hypothetical protein [Clostridia bacterium]